MSDVQTHYWRGVIQIVLFWLKSENNPWSNEDGFIDESEGNADDDSESNAMNEAR